MKKTSQDFDIKIKNRAVSRHEFSVAPLLAWYDRHGRDLPWRSKTGPAAAYHVWLSEIMLQQTTVAAVGPYFEKFLAKWPRLADLAEASLDDVLTAWAGLGYYSRARNLHKCAGVVIAEYGGRFPETEAELLKLPGIGPYTAAAIAAIAFDRPANVVDGNVERVMARLGAFTEPLPEIKPKLKAFASDFVPTDRPGDYAQALMDLGATICTPRKPSCLLCPLEAFCEARKQGVAEQLPTKAKKVPRPVRRGAAFWLQRKDGAVLLRRRPPKGLLGGMMEVPSSEWIKDGATDGEEVLSHAPLKLSWQRQDGLVEHTFTHFHLQLSVYTAKTSRKVKAEGEWVALADLDDQALPTVMKKIIRHARMSLEQ